MRTSIIQLFFVLLLLSGSNWLCAQNKKVGGDIIYYYDAQGNNISNINNAATYDVISKESDTAYVVRTYNPSGPMIRQEMFKDAQLSIANGRFAWYNKTGNIDSTGFAIEGKKDGPWEYHNSTTWKDKHGHYRDSIVEIRYYKKGERITQNSPYERPDTTGSKKAEFPGKTEAWKKYLEKNLKSELGQLIHLYPNLDRRAEEMVSFVIATDGSTRDIFLCHSSGYPFDSEIIRIIKESGKWVPAEQGGKKVIYRQMQSITFVTL